MKKLLLLLFIGAMLVFVALYRQGTQPKSGKEFSATAK